MEAVSTLIRGWKGASRRVCECVPVCLYHLRPIHALRAHRTAVDGGNRERWRVVATDAPRPLTAGTWATSPNVHGWGRIPLCESGNLSHPATRSPATRAGCSMSGCRIPDFPNAPVPTRTRRDLHRAQMLRVLVGTYLLRSSTALRGRGRMLTSGSASFDCLAR